MLEQRIRKFWKRVTILNYLLLPFAMVYYLSFRIKAFFSFPKKVDAKVICVGNITVGGAGKTPFCIALGKKYMRKGEAIAFLSRGYRGSLSTPHRAYKVSQKHTYKEVGDEPILLSQVAPTYICPDRYKSAQLAISEGAKILIMDDGLQNFSLVQDEKILVIDAAYGLGNEMMLPAGPLRETLYNAMKRVTKFYVIGDKIPSSLKALQPTLCTLAVENPKRYMSKKYISMCGIANPFKFLQTLKSIEAKILKSYIFPDHFSYDKESLEEVINHAKRLRCKVITTSKDYIKIPQNLRQHFEVLSISIKT